MNIKQLAAQVKEANPNATAQQIFSLINDSRIIQAIVTQPMWADFGLRPVYIGECE